MYFICALFFYTCFKRKVWSDLMYPNNTYYPQVPYQQPVYPNTNYQNQTPKFNMNNQYQDNSKNSDNINLIYVKDYDSAKDVILQPNQRAWIMNTNCQEFYIKMLFKIGLIEFVKIERVQKQNNKKWWHKLWRWN